MYFLFNRGTSRYIWNTAKAYVKHHSINQLIFTRDHGCDHMEGEPLPPGWAVDASGHVSPLSVEL
jgi:hypothetical protein